MLVKFIKMFLMDDETEPCLTVGKVYEVKQCSGEPYIIDDEDCMHFFEGFSEEIQKSNGLEGSFEIVEE